MGKKNKSGCTLGRALVKDQLSATRGRKHVGDASLLHTTEIHDGYDWGRLNLQSVTEESSFQEFLSTAELAGTEFQAEKLNIKFVNPATNFGLLSDEDYAKITEEHEKNKGQLTIPRRPPWTATTTPSELETNERQHFLEWRRKLAVLQEQESILMTPYEKNLEFWRQLWRVVERSDVVVQIVDARNPLLFRCEDLEKYVKEVSNDKSNLILVNKADFLTEPQRRMWLDYFTGINVRAAFFSATLAAETPSALSDISEDSVNTDVEDESSESDTESDEEVNLRTLISKLNTSVNKTEDKLTALQSRLGHIIENFERMPESSANNVEDAPQSINSVDILNREQLIELFRTIHIGPKVTPNVTTIGLVGYPNVGKSSTINTLMTEKKVSVSATPGKTKHFQTLFLNEDLLLCDCPGLVMPSFVFTKAEMIINGILPIDQMRDHVPAVNLVASLIPRYVIEDKYGIMLPPPHEEENPDRSPTSEELLNAYGYNRGYMTANGQPDNPRSARYVLKDFVNGKLLYATAPPTVPQEEYHTFPKIEKEETRRVLPPREVRVNKPIGATAADVDGVFFKQGSQGVHSKGVAGKASGVPLQIGDNGSVLVNGAKPWKQINKHGNKKKREKLRRIYSHLDQH